MSSLSNSTLSNVIDLTLDSSDCIAAVPILSSSSSHSKKKRPAMNDAWWMDDHPVFLEEPLPPKKKTRQQKSQQEKYTFFFENRASKYFGWKFTNEPLHEKCCICFGKHSKITSVQVPCGHQFGFSCIKKWCNSLGKKRTCPLCNAEILDI